MSKKPFMANGSVANLVRKAADNNSNAVMIKEIELDKIIENELNKFSMNEDIEFEFLKESIKRTGVMQPVILKRNEDDTYTIIAGHRRVRASKAVDKKTVPAIVKNYDDENDILDLVETNLTTRKLTVDDILSSIDILENLLKNSDTKINGKVSEYIGKMLNMSGKQVERYKALSNLIPELKEKVDNKEIGISSVTGIASLPKEKQETALKEIKKTEKETGKLVSREQTKEIKKDVESVDKLIPELRKKVENEEIDLKSGAELSNLSENEQKKALDVIKEKEKEKKDNKPITVNEVKEVKENIKNTGSENSNTAPLKNQITIEPISELSENKSKNENENTSLENMGVLRDTKAKALQQLFSGYITDYLLTHDKDKYLKNLKSFNGILSEEIEKVS